MNLSKTTLLLAANGLYTTARSGITSASCTTSWNSAGSYCTSKARTLTITNSGSAAADNVTYSISPSLPSGTTISPATCGTIASGGTCVLTTTPSSTGTNTPITIQGTNIGTAVTASLGVLT